MTDTPAPVPSTAEDIDSAIHDLEAAKAALAGDGTPPVASPTTPTAPDNLGPVGDISTPDSPPAPPLAPLDPVVPEPAIVHWAFSSGAEPITLADFDDTATFDRLMPTYADLRPEVQDQVHTACEVIAVLCDKIGAPTFHIYASGHINPASVDHSNDDPSTISVVVTGAYPVAAVVTRFAGEPTVDACAPMSVGVAHTPEAMVASDQGPPEYRAVIPDDGSPRWFHVVYHESSDGPMWKMKVYATAASIAADVVSYIVSGSCRIAGVADLTTRF